MSDTSLVPAVQAEASALLTQAAPMTDDEITRTYRTAQMLAASKLYTDVRSAEQGFAKLLIGRTLGLNEHQSLSLYVMEGKVEIPYQMLGNFVRSREGYDYEPAWIKQDAEGNREAVPCTEDTLVDLREIVGASIRFTVDEKTRGVSTWTIEDSQRAGLVREKGNHVKYPRNMFLARAMSNGIKWYVPEVTSGVAIYSEGELERVPNLAEGHGDGSEPDWTLPVPLVAAAERVIRRAKALSHAGYMNRATWKMRLNGQPEDFVTKTLNAANAELDELKAAQSVEPAAPEEDAVTDGGTGSSEPAAAGAATSASESAEGATPDPSPQDASTEDVQGVVVCVMCGKPWDEHSDAQRDECNATADMS